MKEGKRGNGKERNRDRKNNEGKKEGKQNNKGIVIEK